MFNSFVDVRRKPTSFSAFLGQTKGNITYDGVIYSLRNVWLNKSGEYIKAGSKASKDYKKIVYKPPYLPSDSKFSAVRTNGNGFMCACFAARIPLNKIDKAFQLAQSEGFISNTAALDTPFPPLVEFLSEHFKTEPMTDCYYSYSEKVLKSKDNSWIYYDPRLK